MLRKLKAKIRLKKQKQTKVITETILNKREGKKGKFKQVATNEFLTDIEHLFI